MITIDYKDKRPIYEQLIEKIEEMAVRGILEPDSQLMSVRQLAQELSINPNTIQRAYTELERRGITYSVKGRGSFISGNFEKLLSERRQVIFRELDKLCEHAIIVGIEKSEIISQCERFYERQEEGKA